MCPRLDIVVFTESKTGDFIQVCVKCLALVYYFLQQDFEFEFFIDVAQS